MSAAALYIDTGGSVVPVPPEQIADAAQLGWVPASPGQIAAFEAQAKYGTGGQQAIAALEGAGRGLSLGLSTPLERLAGVPAEDIAGREQANPIASGGGEAAGVAASLLVPGLGAVTGPGAALKAGKAATSLVARELPAAATTAMRILRGGAAAGAGSAVEGAFYGAGQVVHEAALGDPHLTAQSALATIGTSAMLLGGLSGTGKVLGSAVREYTPKELGAKFVDMLADAEAHANFNATNAMPGVVKKTMRGKGSGAEAIGREARDLGILTHPLADSPDAILERAESVKKSAGEGMTQLADAASGNGLAAPVTWTSIYQDVHEPIVRALMRQGDTVPLAKQFDAFLSQYAEANAGRDLSVADLWKLKRSVGDFIYKNGKVLDPWVRDLNTPVKRVYDHIDQLIERGIEQGAGSDGLKAWQAASRQYEVASTFATLAESGIERSAANNPLHLSGWAAMAAGLASHGIAGAGIAGAAAEFARRRGASALGFGARLLRDALADGGAGVAAKTAEGVAAMRQAGGSAAEVTGRPEAVATLAALERLNQEAGRKIDAGASMLVNGSSRAANVGRHEAAAGIASIFGRSAEDAQSVYERRAEQLQRMANDPEHLHAALVAQTEGWHEHAPQVAQAMQTTSATAVAFMASVIPQHPKAGPLAPAWVPSRAEAAHVLRVWHAVEHPLSIVKQAAAHTLTPDLVHAVQAVHPALHARIVGAVTEALARRGTRPVAFQDAQMIGMLLGRDLTGAVAQTMAAQAAFAAPPPSQGSARAEKVTLGKRTLTPMQRVGSGEQK